MRNTKPGQQRHRRKSLFFYLPTKYDEVSLYQSMFLEDVQLAADFSRFGRDEGPPILLNGSEEDCEKALALCGSIGGEHRNRGEISLKKAIGNVMSHLANFGRAFYEIVRDADSAAFSLMPFHPESVWDLGFLYLQVAPQATWPYLDRKYAILSRKAVWRVDMPPELGGTRGFRRTLKELSAWPEVGPRFYQDDLEKKQLPIEFVFGDYRTAFQLNLYRSTRVWGWSGRDTSLDYVTEFYLYYRHLTFKWARAVLRQHVMREFNTLLRRLNLSSQLVAEGLSSPGDILKVREQMLLGRVDFASATKAIK